VAHPSIKAQLLAQGVEPAGRSYEGASELSYDSQNIDDLIDCTKVYALTALDVCSRQKP
jgi:hypothetical protein